MSRLRWRVWAGVALLAVVGLAPGCGGHSAGAAPGGVASQSPSGTGGEPPAGAQVPKAPDPRNIILLIADGCGYNQMEATNAYLGRSLACEQFPVRLAMSTYPEGGSYDPQRAWSDFGYVQRGATDSAAAATAMATGSKSYNAAIGVVGDPASPQTVKNILERAEELGKATGVVTTVPFSHATPAGFVAHNANRNNYAQIAQEMLLRSATDVIMGCGHPEYNNDGLPQASTTQYVGGASTWDALKAGTAGADADGDGQPDPWTLIERRDQFAALASGAAPKRVCGVAQAYDTLQQGRSGDAKAAPYTVPFTATVPTLTEMTRAALNVLDDNPRGLVLVVEGGAVDWACHNHQPGRMIEEEAELNHAVEAVAEWAARAGWGQTLVIVTGDHETGYLTGPGSGPSLMPLVSSGPGQLPGLEWHSWGHTNQLIPFYAQGFGSETFNRYADETDPRRGRYLDNTELAKAIFELLG